jgi:sulfur transfer protein SufE
MSLENNLNSLTTEKNELLHYKIFLSFSNDMTVKETAKIKISSNLMANCTAKVWIYKNAGELDAYSESRFINSLINIIKLSNGEFEDITFLLEYYRIGVYFSTFRSENLKALFDILNRV